MNTNNSLKIEKITAENISPLAKLMTALWTDCSYEDEFESCKNILNSETEICFLVKEQDEYIAFIHLTVRYDYVEGSESSPTTYLEAIYVQPNFRYLGVGKSLIDFGEEWGKQKGCKQFASDTELSNLSSIEFHKKNGFREANRIVCFIKDIE